ncbi:acyl-CoA dehydrogenase family protein [Mycobacterium sp. AZCC_0083]|uniref:acyl-CoA dehydrogenase family protein n=1 Tax=Mycobacterium sp. AZCC_0083 TaxID=2735882 RepID=UPI00160BDBE3|nr:acyl-CoA dehydrogenase family protein [Mycobacterium sp. AZCC_0083]MBB5164008.1 alkylation response protein AidB-like acyl-CoA dehydrogenase [Mycobacterium sp. AZCC_0083]
MTADAAAPDVLDELRATVRSFAQHLGGTQLARRAIESPTPGFDPDAWRLLCEQLGIATLGLPEDLGGVGGLRELVAVAEVFGESLLAIPFFGSTVLAGQVLARCGDAAHSTLEKMSEGTICALATSPPFGGQPQLSLVTDGTVSGHVPTVINAPEADVLIAVTAEAVVRVDLPDPGCEVTRLRTLDLTRSIGSVTLRNAACTILHPVDHAAVVRPALEMAALALAAEQLGGSQACLSMTVDYVKERRQFSRTIGSFQAIKHTLADVLIKIELARSALSRALEVESDGPRFAEAAAVARIWCNEAYRFASAEAIQLHGGIGFTWEHDAHLYFRRARSDAQLLGNTADWREHLAQTLQWA